MNYATFKRNGKRGRICFASKMQRNNERLESVVECLRGDFFSGRFVIVLPENEILAGEIFEHGKKLRLNCRGKPVTIPASVFWPLIHAIREADKS